MGEVHQSRTDPVLHSRWQGLRDVWVVETIESRSLESDDLNNYLRPVAFAVFRKDLYVEAVRYADEFNKGKGGDIKPIALPGIAQGPQFALTVWFGSRTNEMHTIPILFSSLEACRKAGEEWKRQTIYTGAGRPQFACLSVK